MMLILAVLCLMLPCWAGALVPPPEPPVKPIIVAPVDIDRDGNKLDDRFEAALEKARLAAAPRVLQAPQPVELLFDRQVTQAQIDAFLELGGAIDHLFTHVSYGWIGTIALEAIDLLPKAMGESLVAVMGRHDLEKHLDIAGRTGRVRPGVWDLGLDGSVGDTDSITVAIIDDGVDGTHADLADRMVYWNDLSADNHATPQNLGHHGSHVAGIAVGSGASAGQNPGSITFSSHGNFPSTPGAFSPAVLRVPESVSSMNWTTEMRWDVGGDVTAKVGLLNSNTTGGWAWIGALVTGTTSPLTYSDSGLPNPYPGHTNRWSPYLTKDSGTGTPRYAATTSVSYAGLGDGYNVFRGVAPGASWAGLKVFEDTGSGNTNYFDSALDDIVAQRETHSIRVANMSLGVSGDPGISFATRAKANTAAQNGIVMVVSAGNDGQKSTSDERVIDDPGRAHYTVTVGAVNDINQVTRYSSEGFVGPGSPGAGSEDTKPDLVAPGGSIDHTMMMSLDSNTGDSLNSSGTQFTDAVADDYRLAQGTSMAAPFVAGAAALVIEAYLGAGGSWHFTGPQALEDALRIKRFLLMTATETNQPRESNSGAGNPTLDRGAKDIQEGYGMINVDAAVDAARGIVFSGDDSDTFGDDPMDKRCWVRKVVFETSDPVSFDLTVPATGDYDLYLYAAAPDDYGNPVILASSTTAGLGEDEILHHTPDTLLGPVTAYVVVKRVAGSGTFTLSSSPAAVGDWHLFDWR